MKKLLILISALLITSSAFSQPGRIGEFRPMMTRNFQSVQVIPDDSLYTIYYLYRVPYDKLVFQKKGNEYSAGFRLTLEMTDDNSDFVDRQIKEEKVSVNNFDATTDLFQFVEGLIEFKVTQGVYNIIPMLTDLNSDRELRLDHLKINAKKENDETKYSLFVAEKDSLECDGQKYIALANFNGRIPFDEKNYRLIISTTDISTDNIYVTVINNGKSIFRGTVKKSGLKKFDLKECMNNIVIEPLEKDNVSNYILDNVTNKLSEGEVLIVVAEDSLSSTSKKFTEKVVWINKPFTLMNPELAIKSLMYIEDENVVDELLSYDEEDYYKELVKFWKKYDPTPETPFNPLMKEYYERVDYAIRNFSSITKRNGLDTDRAKIYIKFGKPDKIERASNEKGKVMETWLYNIPERKFVFVDKTGTGDFLLVYDK